MWHLNEFVKFLIFLAVSEMCRIIIAVRSRIITMRQKCLVGDRTFSFFSRIERIKSLGCVWLRRFSFRWNCPAGRNPLAKIESENRMLLFRRCSQCCKSLSGASLFVFRSADTESRILIQVDTVGASRFWSSGAYGMCNTRYIPRYSCSNFSLWLSRVLKFFDKYRYHRKAFW